MQALEISSKMRHRRSLGGVTITCKSKESKDRLKFTSQSADLFPQKKNTYFFK